MIFSLCLYIDVHITNISHYRSVVMALVRTVRADFTMDALDWFPSGVLLFRSLRVFDRKIKTE